MYSNSILAVSALTVAAACGGASSSATDVSPQLTGPDALNIGSQSRTETATGLPFAGEGTNQDALSFSDNPVTVRLVRFETDYRTGESGIFVTEEVLVTPASSNALAGRLTYKGETIDFPDTGGPAILHDGQPIFAYVNSEGTYGDVVAIYTYDRGEIKSGFDSEGLFVLGLETNPGALPTGSILYEGDFDGFGNALDLDGAVVASETEITGTLNAEVGFGTGDIAGSLTFMATYGDAATIGDTLPFDARLSGNGFSTFASDTSHCPTGCQSATQIGGAFFGPAAEELIGLAGIDYTDVNAGSGIRLVGAGSYVALPFE